MKEAGRGTASHGCFRIAISGLGIVVKPGADSGADANAKALFNLFEMQFRSRGLALNQARMPVLNWILRFMWMPHSKLLLGGLPSSTSVSSHSQSTFWF